MRQLIKAKTNFYLTDGYAVSVGDAVFLPDGPVETVTALSWTNYPNIYKSICGKVNTNSKAEDTFAGALKTAKVVVIDGVTYVKKEVWVKT